MIKFYLLECKYGYNKLFTAIAVFLLINSMKSLDEFSTPFNAVMFQFYHHGMMFLWNIYYLITYFGKSEQMRKTTVRECKDFSAKFFDEVNTLFRQLNETISNWIHQN
jgi:hypothetical protein